MGFCTYKNQPPCNAHEKKPATWPNGANLQHFDEWGFSKTQGIPFLSKARIIFKEDLKHLFPISTLKASCGGRPGIPQGKSRSLTTIVRSLAGENEAHGGANIAPSTLSELISDSTLCTTCGHVKSLSAPFNSSHSRVLQPQLLTALATPALPAKKSAK